MTALDHLRRLLAADPTTVDSTHCGSLICFWCETPLGGNTAQPHAPDCPWVAARAHVEAQPSGPYAVDVMVIDGTLGPVARLTRDGKEVISGFAVFARCADQLQNIADTLNTR